MNLAALLRASAHCHPSRAAVAVGARPLLSYEGLARRAARLASGMRLAGLHAGDRVAIASRNCPQYLEILFAAWEAGLCAVPVNAKLHARELAYVLEDSGARWLFADAATQTGLSPLAHGIASLERVLVIGSPEYERGLAQDAAPEPAPVAPGDPAWLFYTSGTTGRPKGVVLSHDNLLAMAQGFLSDVEPTSPGDAIVHAAPMSHGSGLYAVPHVMRAAVNVLPESGGFDADEVIDLIGHWPGACLFAAPTMVMRLVRAPRVAGLDQRTLRAIVYGGGPMYVEDCRAAWNVFPGRLAQIYGQGESPMTITAMPRAVLDDAIARADAGRIGSVGVAQSGVEIRIAPAAAEADTDANAGAHSGSGAVAEGGDAARGGAGEVLVRGRPVMQGYWRNPSATASTLAGGWLHTGDVGALDRDGFLTLLDRSKDLVISGGSNVYPREIEEVLLRHPRVAEVAVVGRRHPDWGEEVVACVVSRDGGPVAADELDALCLAHLARFKRPRAYVMFSELPKNETGKVLKTRLRETVSR